MKAIFYLPAHPAYFRDEYTQAEIDKAIEDYDRSCGGIIFTGNSTPKVKEEFVLLRAPGKSVTVVFDSSGFGDGKAVADYQREHAFDQYRGTSGHALRTHVHNIQEFLKMNQERL